ncbi:MAG: proteasome assembly chaperone family protein [Pseudoclavibacter sp.]
MDAERLVHREWPTTDLPPGMPLVVVLAGYRDAGQVVPQLREHLTDDVATTLVATVDIDEVFDYRARRPIVSIEGTTLGDVRMPSLTLRLLHDDSGTPYLLLEGLEPDYRWNALADEIVALADDLEVASVTWVHSFAMPVPHTRPVRLSVTGNRSELAEQLSVWSPHTEAPAHFAHVLGSRLSDRDYPVLGLVALIPHYVSEVAVPSGAIAVIEGLGTATGLMLSTSSLREADREFRQSVDEQITNNHEVLELIASLEQQHDAYLANLPNQPSIISADDLPSADDLASELEQFLARTRDASDKEDKRDQERRDQGPLGDGDGPGDLDLP